jgi:hypothetical protein
MNRSTLFVRSNRSYEELLSNTVDFLHQYDVASDTYNRNKYVGGEQLLKLINDGMTDGVIDIVCAWYRKVGDFIDDKTFETTFQIYYGNKIVIFDCIDDSLNDVIYMKDYISEPIIIETYQDFKNQIDDFRFWSDRTKKEIKKAVKEFFQTYRDAFIKIYPTE